jgi:CHAT domain-containing protein/tetratricopeptide (TPR) repeat protein
MNPASKTMHVPASALVEFPPVSRDGRLRRFAFIAAVIAFVVGASGGFAGAQASPSLEQRLAQAERLRVAEKWEAAVTLLEQILREVEADPTRSRVRNGCLKSLAATYFELGRYADALRSQSSYLAVLRKIEGVERRDLVAAAQSVADLEATLDRPSAAVDVLSRSLEYAAEKPLNPIIHIQALLKLALFEQRAGRDAQKSWQAAERIGVAALKQIDARAISAAYRPTIVRELAAAYVGLDQRERAVELFDRELKDPAFAAASGERVSLLAAFAEQLAEVKRFEQSARVLEEAIALSRRAESNDRQLGTLLINLAVAQESAGRHAEAQRHWREVAECRERVISLIETGLLPKRLLESNLDESALAYFRLNDSAREIDALNRLLTCRREFFGTDHPSYVRTQARLGMRHALAGDLAAARPLLSAIVDYERKRGAEHASSLADALNNLGNVERSLGSFQEARRLIDEALAIHDKSTKKYETARAEILYNLAGIHFATGQYHEAVRRYSDSVEVCRISAEATLKPAERAAADRLCSRALLSLAMVYKSQGQVDQASRMCLESLAIQDANAASRDVDKAPHYNALAALNSSQQRYSEALQWARKAFDATRKDAEGTTAATARHQLAHLHWLAGKFAEADELWREALATYRRQGQFILVAKTLNYLGVSAYQQHRLGEAEKFFREAHKIYQDNEAAPQDHYSVLCNLASIAYAGKSYEEGLNYLREAVELTELPRAAVFGAERERAEFFARFSRAFDLLIDWQLEQGRVEQAFGSMERSRNRTFLDQLDLAGVDLRSTLADSSNSILKTERELNIELSSLRAQERKLQNADERTLTRHREKLAATQRRYAEVWTEIRNASKYYREILSRDQDLASLGDLRRSIVDDRTLMLCYYMGATRCYLFVVGHGERDLWSFPLEIAASSADSANQRPRPAAREASVDLTTLERGLVDTIASPKGLDLIKEGARTAIKPGPIDARQLTRLVAWYREDLRDVDFGQTRGITGAVASQKGNELRASSLVLGDVLLPKAVRELIRERAPEQLVIVPDGALHQLPFESILLDDGSTSKFALDVFPPIAYAPSANILRKLLERKSGASVGKELLVVGDPAYASPVVSSQAKPTVDSAPTTFNALPGTKLECERIAAAFSAEGVVVKLGTSATERDVRGVIEGRTFIHLAAHGFVREGHDNLFGAIALATPHGTSDPDDDGFLELREIQSLKLNGCELAVLSACDTNVGPERPLEAASTLAQAFLSAGSKRVVASHWSVADESTAELMAIFFQEIARGRRENRTVSYAKALQTARRKVRDNPRWSAPFFWAPFVLIGPSS